MSHTIKNKTGARVEVGEYKDRLYAFGYASARAKRYTAVYSGEATPEGKAQCQRSVEQFLRNCHESEMRRKAEKAEQRERRKAENADAPEIYIPGTIVYNSWGYDQTNIDWYIITERSGDTCTLQRIGSRQVEVTAWMAGTVEPNPDVVLTNYEPIRKRVSKSGGEERGFSMKHGWCSMWDGRPKYESSYH